MNKLLHILLMFLGSIFVALGILGVFLPLLPTTPFLLLGASCYVKGSPRLYKWLINNKLLGQYIKNYREGKGIPVRTKAIAIIMLWTAISFSVFFVISKLFVRIILLLIASGVTWHILSIKNLQEDDEEELTEEQDTSVYEDIKLEGNAGEILQE